MDDDRGDKGTSTPGFRDSTAVEPAGPGRWTGIVADGWDILGNSNGGYVQSIVARAMSAASSRPDPVSVTAHYLEPVTAGPVEVHTEVVRDGRRFATVSGRLERDGIPLVEMIATFGDLGDPDADSALIVRGGPPELPPPDDCADTGGSEESPAFMSRVDLRIHPDDAGFHQGRPSGVPRLRAWFRLPVGEPLDTIGLLLASDAFPPTIFNANLPIGWTPTVSLTTHVRRRPAPGWLRANVETRFVADGMLEIDAELWDDTDSLVAQSRQLALVPRGR